MKQVINCILVGSLVFAGASHAKKYRDSTMYYLGLDGQYTFAEGKGEWNKVFKKQHPGFNIYIGGRINDYLGLELGYSGTTKKSKKMSVANNATSFGIINGGASTSNGQLRLENTHFDLNGYFPMNDMVEGIATVGIGFSRQSISIETTPNTNLGLELAKVKGKTAAVGRIGFGLQAMFTESVGVRGMWRYETLSRVKLRDAPAAAGAKAFKNSHTLGLGFIWNTNL